jgi:leader peptidase (prepilin peptidase)/N-methyltransferase
MAPACDPAKEATVYVSRGGAIGDDVVWAAPMLLPALVALLCLAVASIAWIDLRHGIIPDWLNLTVFALGLIDALARGGASAAVDAAWQAAAIGAITWLLRRFYFAIRKTQGLGLGDVKLLAAATAWIGVGGITLMLLVAALTALTAAGVIQMAGQPMTRRSAIPFGPFLAIGLLATLALQHYGCCFE